MFPYLLVAFLTSQGFKHLLMTPWQWLQSNCILYLLCSSQCLVVNSCTDQPLSHYCPRTFTQVPITYSPPIVKKVNLINSQFKTDPPYTNHSNWRGVIIKLENIFLTEWYDDCWGTIQLWGKLTHEPTPLRLLSFHLQMCAYFHMVSPQIEKECQLD